MADRYGAGALVTLTCQDGCALLCPSPPARNAVCEKKRRRGKGFVVAAVLRRPLSSGLTAAGGLCALLIGLAVIDDRVRDQIARVFARQGPTPEMASVGSRLEEMAAIVAHAMRDQSIEHAPMVIFAVAAMVLVLFMTRT